jgi:hypothetical protein
MAMCVIAIVAPCQRRSFGAHGVALRRIIGIVRLTGEDAIKLLTLHTPLMRTSVSLYHRHRFPAEMIRSLRLVKLSLCFEL